MRSFPALALGLLMAATVAGSSGALAQEKVRYLRDWISIPLRETTNSESTIIHKGVVSGAALTLLESDDKAGATRVRTADGIEGWLPTRYLTTEPGARSQLDKAQLEIERLNKLNEQLRLGAPSVAALQESSAKQVAEAQVQNNKLNEEVATLKNNIGDNSKLVQEHTDLGKHAAELQDQVIQLNTEIVELRAGQRQSYFRDGAISVGAGALLTLLAANFWPRKKRTDWA